MKQTMVRTCAIAALAAGLSAVSWGVRAQSTPLVQPMNVVQLSAVGSVEVPQDLLIMTLAASEEGSNAAGVQKRLQQIVDAALAVARPQSAAGAMDVRTGSFNIYPRSSPKDGKVSGWQGRAQLVLQGKDFDRITSTAAKLQDMTVAQVTFGLSKEARSKVEGEAQSQAIAQFQARASSLTKAFGFASYGLREVSVNSNESGYRANMDGAAMFKGAMPASASESAPLSVEAGKARVEVHVAGSVQMK